MGVVRLSNAGIRDFQKVDNFLAGNEAFSLSAEDFLEEVVLTSSATSVTFTGLDAYSDYKHLQIRWVTRTDRNNNIDVLDMILNADTSVSHKYKRLWTNGSSIGSFAESAGLNSARVAQVPTDNNTDSNQFAAGIIDILDFNSATKNTTTRSLSGNPASASKFLALWSGALFQTDSITSIKLQSIANQPAGSRFSLYGAK